MDITVAQSVFHGTTKEGIALLPTKVNVAIATALASAGPEQTTMNISAVPGFKGDKYKIEIQGEEVSAELNILDVMRRRLTLTGSTLRPRSNQFKALLAQEIVRHAWPLVERGQLRPVMDRTFPLAEAAAAHTRMEAGEHVGKIVLAI